MKSKITDFSKEWQVPPPEGYDYCHDGVWNGMTHVLTATGVIAPAVLDSHGVLCVHLERGGAFEVASFQAVPCLGLTPLRKLS